MGESVFTEGAIRVSGLGLAVGYKLVEGRTEGNFVGNIDNVGLRLGAVEGKADGIGEP